MTSTGNSTDNDFYNLIASIDCSSNILISKHGEGLICDFGFSITLPERRKGKTLVTAAKNLPIPATVGYMPPEYCEGKYSTWSDVYSYGIVRLLMNSFLWCRSEYQYQLLS